MPAGGRAAGVGQEHDLGLQPFRGVDGHHPHGGAGAFHVALDRKIESFDAGEKAREPAGLLAFEVEREPQEFIDCVIGLRPEPRDQPLAPAPGAERARIKVERRQLARLMRPLVDRSRRCLVRRLPRASQGVEQRTRAPRRERQKIVIGQADERRFQQCRQRQIVLAQQSGAAQGDEVHHRHVIGELQPVGAGDRDVFGLQRADDALEKRVALAHEDQYVSRRHGPRPAIVLDAFAALSGEQRFDLARDFGGEPRGRVGVRAVIERQAPVRGRLGLIGANEIPDFNERRRRPASRRSAGAPALAGRRSSRACCRRRRKPYPRLREFAAPNERRATAAPARSAGRRR